MKNDPPGTETIPTGQGGTGAAMGADELEDELLGEVDATEANAALPVESFGSARR
jgi:hypothetical protein